jgi:hypothetical protein
MDGVAVMNDKAGRFRDFFDLQLRFAEAVAEATAMPVAEAVLRYANLHRRFGLGDVTADQPHPSWHAYARELSRLASHEARAAWTQAFFAQSPDERLSFLTMCLAVSISMRAMAARSFACTSTIATRSVR